MNGTLVAHFPGLLKEYHTRHALPLGKIPEGRESMLDVELQRLVTFLRYLQWPSMPFSTKRDANYLAAVHANPPNYFLVHLLTECLTSARDMESRKVEY
jgi:hypothetical protein